MTDTQWHRFEVFVQEKAGVPHQNVGAVHAPDEEIALQNARDVFVRRPDCVSLWVVPAEMVFAKTAQELAEDSSWRDDKIDSARRDEVYYVFQKQSSRASATFVTYVGQVQAQAPAQALSLALMTWSESRPFVWWVFPACAVTHSQPEDVDSMFATAKSKAYRHSTQYHTVTQMKQVKSGKT
jgi:ring-1,2-phenylacetyl-CoA epoxidase subunit PaaB